MWFLSFMSVVLAFALVICMVTLQFQAALGCGLVLVVLGLLEVPADRPNQRTQTVQHTPSQRTEQETRQEGPQPFSLKVFRPEVRLEKNPRALSIVLSASRYYSVPAEVLLTHWYLESGMRLGGDGGGAGGYSALRQIIRKQSEPAERHRWHRFAANERDILAICAHCGYDCNAIQGSSTGALGPMQFQPSTWVLGAVDADGDGRACPLNLTDALFTAAMKLRNDYGKFGDWNRVMLEYAGGDCARNRAYVRRAQPILRQFRTFLSSRNLLASN